MHHSRNILLWYCLWWLRPRFQAVTYVLCSFATFRFRRSDCTWLLLLNMFWRTLLLWEASVDCSCHSCYIGLNYMNSAVDTGIASSLGLFWKILHYTATYKSFWGHMFSWLSGRFLGLELQSLRESLFYLFKKLPFLFPRWFHHFTLP